MSLLSNNWIGISYHSYPIRSKSVCMIKFFLFFLLISSGHTLAFCHESNNVKIEINVVPYINETEQKLYVHYNNGNNCEIHDSVTIRPGKRNYTLHSFVPYEDDITLSFSKRGPAKLRILVCPNDNVVLTIEKEDDVVGVRHKKLIKGKAHNDLYFEFWTQIFTFVRERQLIEDSIAIHGIPQQSIDILKKKYDSIAQKRRDYIKNIALTSPSPAVASVAQLLTWNEIPRKEWDSLLHIVYQRFPDYVPIQYRYFKKKWPAVTETGRTNQMLIEKVIRSRIAINNLSKKDTLKVGQKLNISLLDRISNIPPLSVYYGKYVLIEMWASWCLPCIKAMPNIIAAQERFKNDFICCALSIDKSETSWKNSIKKHKLGDLCHYKVTDSAGEVIKEYRPLIAKGTIPQNYLLDRDGKIIAINIYGEELIKKLEELTKK